MYFDSPWTSGLSCPWRKKEQNIVELVATTVYPWWCPWFVVDLFLLKLLVFLCLFDFQVVLIPLLCIAAQLPAVSLQKGMVASSIHHPIPFHSPKSTISVRIVD